MDVFSRAGLAITAIKVHRMSVAEAEDFYGPVRAVLREKLVGPIGAKAKDILTSALALKISPENEQLIGQILGPIAGEEQFHNIVRFMAGRNSLECSPAQRQEPGTEKCITLVYEGLDAVKKIREVLGPTDPSKAPPGSIRREFGQTIMVNAAHASDSTDNAERELGIVKIDQNPFQSLIQNFYKI
jgi:nucleoside diphosphate kinase